MTDVVFWGETIPESWLTEDARAYLLNMPDVLPDIDWLWREMDRVWDELGLDNCGSLSLQPIGEFYSHPVWFVNGLFTHHDPVSAAHRESIANYLRVRAALNIADYGGGFGELALMLVRIIPDARVSIVEPYPSQAGSERLKWENNIAYVPAFEAGGYDAVVAQDVLEHVEDPVKLAYEIADNVRDGGFAIFANCFYPVIKCHLPRTFHFRYTFPGVMRAMGMRYVGRIEGAAHAHVFQRNGPINMEAARRAESRSRIIGPILNMLGMIKSRVTNG